MSDLDIDIDRPYTSLQKKYEVLKTKCDKQLDYINELMNVNKSLENEILQLKIGLEIPQKKIETNTNNYVNFFNWYFEIISKIVADAAFLETKNRTQNTTAYRMVEYKSFIEYVENVMEAIEHKKFIEFGILFGIVYEDPNGKSIFTHTSMGKSVRVIRIRVEVVRYIRECMNI